MCINFEDSQDILVKKKNNMFKNYVKYIILLFQNIHPQMQMFKMAYHLIV